MEDSIIILTLRTIIVFFAGLVAYLLLFGYIIPDYIIAEMPENQKGEALKILTNAAYIAYVLAFFTFIFLPLKIKPVAVWKKIVMFFVIYTAFWFGYIVIA